MTAKPCTPARLATQRRLGAVLCRALAQAAAEGQTPTVLSAQTRMPPVAEGRPPALHSLRTYGSYAVRDRLAVREQSQRAAPNGQRYAVTVYWPGPAVLSELSPEEVAAWEAARQEPPVAGTVRVGGHLYRVVDGEALGAVPGGDWLLLRGGRAVSTDGMTSGRWEVVHG
mgnify:CR=1 FL=1